MSDQPPKPATRFENAINCLRELKRQRPECEGEAEIAINILQGRRPGISEKYEALLLKLDRAHSQMCDRREMMIQLESRATTTSTKHGLIAKRKALNMVINDLQWMRARNRDMIELGNKINENTKTT